MSAAFFSIPPDSPGVGSVGSQRMYGGSTRELLDVETAIHATAWPGPVCRVLFDEDGVPAVTAKSVHESLLDRGPPSPGGSADHHERQRRHDVLDGLGDVQALADSDGHPRIELSRDTHAAGGLPCVRCHDQQHHAGVPLARECPAGRERRSGAVRRRGQHMHRLESHESKIPKRN